MTDTDSLIYEIQTDDFYKDIENDIKTKFDTSAYPADHKGIKLRTNKKVIGMTSLFLPTRSHGTSLRCTQGSHNTTVFTTYSPS